jgi:hypothetical protein
MQGGLCGQQGRAAHAGVTAQNGHITKAALVAGMRRVLA